MSHVIFKTPRLLGRHLEPNDLTDLLEVYGDAEAMRWVDDGEPLSRADAIRWLEVTKNNYERYGYGMSALIEPASGETVGFCGLVHPDGQSEAEIKYALKRRYWRKGLATEAVQAMLAYGAKTHGLGSVIATTAPENAASHRVLLKSGMVQGELRANDDGSSVQVFEWLAGGPSKSGST